MNAVPIIANGITHPGGYLVKDGGRELLVRNG